MQFQSKINKKGLLTSLGEHNEYFLHIYKDEIEVVRMYLPNDKLYKFLKSYLVIHFLRYIITKWYLLLLPSIIEC